MRSERARRLYQTDGRPSYSPRALGRSARLGTAARFRHRVRDRRCRHRRRRLRRRRQGGCGLRGGRLGGRRLRGGGLGRGCTGRPRAGRTGAPGELTGCQAQSQGRTEEKGCRTFHNQKLLSGFYPYYDGPGDRGTAGGNGFLYLHLTKSSCACILDRVKSRRGAFPCIRLLHSAPPCCTGISPPIPAGSWKNWGCIELPQN